MLQAIFVYIFAVDVDTKNDYVNGTPENVTSMKYFVEYKVIMKIFLQFKITNM